MDQREEPIRTIPSTRVDRREPIRTILSARVGLGVAQAEDALYVMLTVDDDATGGTIDILIDKALFGEVLAHGDEVRRRINTQEVRQ